MSSGTATSERRREAVFGIGTFVGMLVFALGLAFLVLAMSVGVRSGQSYLPPGTRTVIAAAGAALVVVGFGVRLFRRKLSPNREDLLRAGGTVAVLVGVALALFGLAADTTVSAPFLASPGQKVLLFGIAYGCLGAGLILLRATARIVGW